MRARAGLITFAAVWAAAAAGAQTTTYQGRPCAPPSGYKVADCRLAVHGTPDLSRAAWRALRGKEVTIGARISTLAANPAAAGARDWPLVDSLGQPMGRLTSDGVKRITITDLAGTPYRADVVRIRGHGCAASLAQQRRFVLVQVIAPKALNSGTQAFIDTAALDQATPDGQAALSAFRGQAGGGTGCGPSGRETGALRTITDPAVGATAHARLSNGQINSVNEYDAKPAFGNVVYFSSNTTDVAVGGIARGMVRIGTPARIVDRFGYCDPNSDGTLTWRYWSIHTSDPRHPRLYGFIPARCPRARR